MGFLDRIFGVINDLTWGWALVPFLVVLGVFFTIASGLIQFRFFKRMFNVLKGDEDNDPNKISAREALFVSVGGRVGGGNIAGVAVAITAGGPGAVFWMWAIALVGMCTSLIEATLAQLYKRTDTGGDYRGGPAQSIIHGLGENYRWLAIIYAICLIASFAIGFNAFQGNTVAGAALDSMHIPRLWTGIALSLATGVIVFGGIHRIAKAADVIIPVMAFGYIGMALLVIVLNLTSLPGVLWEIFANAFGLREAVPAAWVPRLRRACVAVFSRTRRASARHRMSRRRPMSGIRSARASRRASLSSSTRLSSAPARPSSFFWRMSISRAPKAWMAWR